MVNTVRIEDVYRNNDQLKESDVSILKNWVHLQQHLPKITELQTILFLHSCDYSVEAAKNCIDNFFTFKTLCKDVFANRKVTNPKMLQSLKVGLITILPILTKENCAVLFCQVMDSNPDLYDFSEQFRNMDMSIMSYLYQFGPVNGILLVYDMEGVVFGHMTKFSLLQMKKFCYYLQEAVPVRLKGMHFFNTVPFTDKILALMKPFMKKELHELLYVHQNMNSLHKYVPQDCLPQEYGGKSPSKIVLQERLRNRLLECQEIFDFEDGQKVDETKRADKQKGEAELFGVEGTFRKLEVD